MRVIAGIAKGRRLKGPRGLKIRPALDKVKGAIFNIIGESIVDKTVLDLFAGTGSIGIEALSRGARSAAFVDSDRDAIALIKKNLEDCGFLEYSEVIHKSVEAAINWLNKRDAVFDFIFIDPPYDKNYVSRTLAMFAKGILIREGTWLIVEHSPREMPQGSYGDISLVDRRKYGQTYISIFENVLKKGVK